MKQVMKEFKYACYLIRHPFKGFWEIKHEKEGSLRTGLLILILTIITQILSKLLTGYLFGGIKNANYNLFSTIFTTIGVYAAWAIANWCLTCLSDGKGTLKDICMATGYALLPYVIIQLPMILLSNYFVSREIVFYNILNGLALVWTAFLIIISQISIHQFTLTRAIIVIIFTVVGMLAIACLVLLFFNLIQQVMVFVSIFIEELILRFTYS